MIITNNEDALRVFCEPVLPDEVGALVEILENELDQYNRIYHNGIGLAAPQIGIAKNISIIRLEQYSLNLVNASILQSYDPLIFKEEGCLSFPGRVENTKRFQEVVVKNSFGDYEKFVAKGFLAVAIQHEIDHLNSTLFMDHGVKPKLKGKPNDPCVCGSMKKFKKCCGK